MSEPVAMGIVKTRCPKCRSTDLTACETTEATMLFDISASIMTRLTFTEEFSGFVGVDVTCKKCGHGWTPRGAHQVTDLLRGHDD